jgi:valyl-tRNA synthetase
VTTPRSEAAEPTDLPTAYDPAAVEVPLYERWVERGYFEADDHSDKPPYCIVIPPPNVTGSLHLGHAFEHTLIDALVRRRRMQGYEALWMPGMDHAGIATQNVVERELAKEGVSRHDLGREAFVEKVWEWKAQSGGMILGQMRRLGDGVAWSRERFTMDDGLSRAVLTIFKRLYEDGLIYRAERIINWCVRCHTALSDIEVEHSDDEGELISIRYGDEIVVATTRAETMLGDTAVAVNPNDERYQHLISTDVELPLTGRRIPVVADEHVDPEFGTGMVKVTPAHDPNDFGIGQRHGLPNLTIMDEQGVITAHGPYEGLDRFEARPAIVAALRAQGRIVEEKRPYTHSVGHCSRCKTVVEPRLSLQWFVKTEPLARAAGDAVRDGRVRIHPKDMEPRWFSWVDNMHDWCISRQLWWGHRIPVWYGPDDEVVCVGPDDEPPSGDGWHQDEDVLDTWFSSALWPFSTLGWPDKTPALDKFYPNQVLVTGYDILFFWVARMMMFGTYANADRGPAAAIPFSTVALHGMVRDKHGKKMSKSFGNAVDPQEWMDAYGSDALRFTLARGANPGTDVPIGEDWVQASRNFCNKLWNATRFALRSGAKVGDLPPPDQLSDIDRWILSRLHRTLGEVDALYEDYQFAKLTDALYHFAWDEFCDWYVELAKTPLAEGGEAAERTRLVLGHVLDVLLRVLHPITPFVTEALWTTLRHSSHHPALGHSSHDPALGHSSHDPALAGAESLVVADWPKPDDSRVDTKAEAAIAELQRVTTEIRRFRSDQGLKPGQRVEARLGGASGIVAEHETEIRALARLAPEGDRFTSSASLGLTTVTVDLDLSGAIDVGAERRRLDKDLAAARKELDQVTGKLGNEQFLAKAPDHVVERMREREKAARTEIGRLESRLAALPDSSS